MANHLPTLLQAGVQVATAVLYIWVARIVLARNITGDARRANTLFGIWWLALALVFVAAPILNVSTRVFGVRNLGLAITLLNLLLVLIAAAVWGLVYYLAYLYTGNSRLFWPITAFYIGLAGLLIYVVAWLGPVGFEDSGAIRYARQRLDGGPAIALGVLLSLPVVAAALAYGSLYFRIDDPAARYRIGLISGGFLLQWGWSLVSGILGLSRRYPDSLVLRLIGSALAILAALAVLLAFRPPAKVRARLGIAEPGGS